MIKEYLPGQIINGKIVVRVYTRLGDKIYYIMRCQKCGKASIVQHRYLKARKSCVKCRLAKTKRNDLIRFGKFGKGVKRAKSKIQKRR